jgi:hypothetical protein
MSQPYYQYQKMLSMVISTSLLLLAACSSNTSPAPSASPSASRTITAQATPKTRAIPAGTVLYQFNWSQGLDGWRGTAGWRVVQGMLQSNLSNDNVITSPYMPTVTDYAVEVRFQIVNVPQGGGYFTVTADRAQGKDGYTVGILGFLGPGPHSQFANPEVNSYIDPLSDMDSSPVIADYEPGSVWHTYRVEVQGPQVSFFIDGLRKSFATSSQTNFLSNGPIHLKAAKAVINISTVRIIAL